MKTTKNENILGIDIGNNFLRACIHNDEILEFIKVPSTGIQAGNIVNTEEFTNALRHLINKVKKNYNIKKVKLIFGLASSSLNSGNLNVSISVNNKNSIVGLEEVQTLIEKNDAVYNTHNLSILYYKIKKYKLNNIEQKDLPLGQRGSRLDARVFSIFIDKKQIRILQEVCRENKFQILDILASPLLEAELLLENKQKLSGVAVLHIGSSISSLSVFEKYIPLAVGSLSFGTQDIDNEIALGLKISLEEAYEVRQGIKLTGFNKKKYEDLIDKILTDWAHKINSGLDLIKRKELLPGGIVVLGEISNMIRFESVFKNKLKLPIRLDRDVLASIKDYNIRHTEWLRPLSLAIFDPQISAESTKSYSKIYNHIKNILCQFLP